MQKFDTSTILRKRPKDITPEEWQALYNELTPENRLLFRLKIAELLAEQEQATANK